MEFEKTQKIIFGLDLGQSHDYSAMAGIETVQKFTHKRGGQYPAWGTDVSIGDPLVIVRFLHRWPLDTSYPDIVRDVQKILNRTKQREGKEPALVIDYTGVGRPVFDMFKESELRPKGISIHGGNTVSHENGVYNVPKRDLVGALQVLYQNDRIKISGALPEKKQLNHELLNFKVKVSDSGHDTYEAWREKDHDDLVLAVACAVWFANRGDGWGWKSGGGFITSRAVTPSTYQPRSPNKS